MLENGVRNSALVTLLVRERCQTFKGTLLSLERLRHGTRATACGAAMEAYIGASVVVVKTCRKGAGPKLLVVYMATPFSRLAFTRMDFFFQEAAVANAAAADGGKKKACGFDILKL